MVASLKELILHESILVNYDFTLVINNPYLLSYLFKLYLLSTYYVLGIALGGQNQQFPAFRELTL